MTLTVAQLITETCQGLQAVDAPRLEAQLLVAQALGRDRAWLYAHGEDPAPEDVIEQVRQWALRRSAGEPAAYLLGRREFWSLDLKVGPQVLIPRPDTEVLVEAALSHLDEDSNASIIDLGTGSGAIALALATERPKARITATDRSSLALGMAADNARHLGLDTRVQWVSGSWYAPLGDTRFDMIVSNPPYVADADPHLAQLDHEPREALVSGADGLDDLRHIVAGAPHHLRAGGWLLVEHGADQGAAVRALFQAAGLSQVGTLKDLAGRDRVTLGCRD
ncbi:peptide chain release factor N(5)-glutamine methyltransferase [Ectothiorhodospira sp. BSL-9]|uniref:peptide chain release factor N(5)-glutamine methyltransferase n=1 Tax=Ectothiorhodospira sp. BSL-9 TaxID=1442136 RepID=UPI0009EDE6EC|nr:peptide chain release factor N(5)-glutamine methyltransferase [Ectothiorhodospira sp. BSL-9]